jgi:hypothetical protein
MQIEFWAHRTAKLSSSMLMSGGAKGIVSRYCEKMHCRVTQFQTLTTRFSEKLASN